MMQGDGLIKFIKTVLVRRFPKELPKQDINESTKDKLNFACPYCGDSQKDLSKKRGNLYLSTGNYKCYNDGCGIKISLDKFVNHFSKKYSLDIVNLPSIKPITRGPIILTSKKKQSVLDILLNQEVSSTLLTFSEIATRFNLMPCQFAPEGSPIWEWSLSRKLTDLPSFKSSCYYDSKYNKIYIFNLDLKSDKILGFAIRQISEDWIGPKYNIKTYGDFRDGGLVKASEDTISKIDRVNGYFNILNITFSKPIIITEGQIDSMFLDNAIAIGGVTKIKPLLETTINKRMARVLFDNDKAGRTHTMELLKDGYFVFLWTNLISDLKRRWTKDIYTIRKIKDINDLYCFLSSRDPELTYSSFNQYINNYFSNSVFDLLSI